MRQSQRLECFFFKRKSVREKKKRERLNRARTEEKSLKANPAEIRYPLRFGALLLFIS